MMNTYFYFDFTNIFARNSPYVVTALVFKPVLLDHETLGDHLRRGRGNGPFSLKTKFLYNKFT